MAKKEIDWNLYAKVDVLPLYDLIHLSLDIHPSFPTKKIIDLGAELDEQRQSRFIICMQALKDGELKQHSHNKGVFLSYPSKAPRVLVQDFVQFALKWNWELPEEFPVCKKYSSRHCAYCHYSTKLIKAQEEAIKKFWANFDPLKPETEPKGAVIIDWLVTEHGVSERIASAIATIIRPDGLNPGIKKQKKPSH